MNQFGCAAVASLTIAFALAASLHADEPLPAVEDLPRVKELPDPLRMMSGEVVTTAEQWREARRPELKRLFQHYMYGYLPAAPDNFKATLDREDKEAFGGKATLRELTLRFGPAETPPIHLLLVVPNQHERPAPVFVGANFCGNHAVIDDPKVAIPTAFMPQFCAGVENNQAGEAGRGARVDVWNLEASIDRGYAVATFYCGDVDPDRPDFTDGVHPHYFKEGQTEPGPHDWGTVAAWAWGVHRAVDYLVTDEELDAKRIAVVGHSRLGKTALLAAAFDDRIALAIPHQAGCGGTAPSRGTVGESVARINTSFPHWFNDTFPKFNDQTDRLPFDQHCLVALVAPRPVLFSNAEQDTWANPAGQFEVLRAADPVYRLLEVEGLANQEMPKLNGPMLSRLAFFIRPGEHSMTREDWEVFWDFADAWMK